TGRTSITELPRYETLSIEMPVPGVLVVRFNRPEVRTAINTQMVRDLVDLFTDINADPSRWRCIILTGSGDQAFCAGGDLKERRRSEEGRVGKECRSRG